MARDKDGKFLPGPDKDRHKFTRKECQKGFQAALSATQQRIEVWAWLYKKCRKFYGRRGRRR